MILQGTTPTLTITVNPDELLLSDVVEIELTFQSGTQTPTKKSMSDLTIDTEANTMAYTFTEQETLDLSATTMLIWQVRFKLQSGVIVGTVKKSIKVLDLIMRRTSVTTLANVSAFLNTPIRGRNSQTAKIYVPEALIDDYKAATNWKTIDGYGFVEWCAIEGSEYEL